MPKVILDYKDKKTERLPSMEELEVNKVLQNHTSENYTDVLQKESRVFMFEQLSDYRSSVLRWYPFDEAASVLEIDAGMGAMTGALCDRVREVTVTVNSVFCAEAIAARYRNRDNLTIYAADYRNVAFKEKFDYIILFGQLEKVSSPANQIRPYADYIDTILSLLKPDGILLLEAENQYGIHNLCGQKDSHSGIAFDALAGYPERNKGRGFHKAELTKIMQSSQAKTWKFYYPMPDYIAPRAILTDLSDIGESIRERLPGTTISDESAICNDYNLYVDAAVNGVYDFVTNHFIVEVSKGSRACTDISYVQLSTTRTREKSFATVLHKDSGKAEKKPLYREGAAYAGKLCDTIGYLQQHGINVLSMEMIDGSIWMEYVDARTIQQHLSDLVRDKEPIEQFIGIFDRLWENILQSSERTEDCSLDIGAISKEALGPILKYAYVELISLNSFWFKDDILYFDQEFMREGYPAKYILMRSIFCCYGFIDKCEEYLPQKVLMERYGITKELYNFFAALEDKLGMDENPDRVEQWYQVSEEKMRWNRYYLSKDVSSQLSNYCLEDTPFITQIADVQMRLLYRFKEVCEQNKLTYYLMYGTLLGAVRHKGKIPGDDDIDVAMPREDYDKLLQIADAEFEPPYFLQTPSNDNCFYGGYSKLMNLDTTAVSVQNWWTDCKEGISIDVFPLDYGYADKRREKNKVRKIAFYQRLLYAKAYGYFANFKDMPLLIWKAYKYFGKLYSKEDLIARLNASMKAGEVSADAPYGIYAHYTEGKVKKQLKAKDFETKLMMRYEALELPVPSGYHHILKIRYGKDYMSLLKREEGEILHGFYVVNVPSDNYKKRFQGGWRLNPAGKKIVLFGDPYIVEQYMKVKGSSFAPEYIVFDTTAPWTQIQDDSLLADAKQYILEAKENIDARGTADKVVDWEEYEKEIHDSISSDSYPVICTVNIRETERRLRRLGVREYYIFAWDRNMIAYKEPLEYIMIDGENKYGR